MSSVRDGPAVGVDSASARFQTRKDATVVLATFVRVAVTVPFAFVLLATDGRISSIAARTETDGPVIRDATLCTTTARADLARIFTLSIETSLFHGAIRVGSASSGTAANPAELAGRTLVIGRTLETTTALNAGFSATTVVVLGAGFRAESGVTRTGRAVAIGCASGRSDGTSNLRITNRSSWASTLGGVVDDFADSAVTADVRNSTRIYTIHLVEIISSFLNSNNN